MRRFVTQNSLSLFFGLLFLGSLAGQSVAGWQAFNDQQVGQMLGEVTWWRYVTSAEFAVAVTENWQSEYLQFLVFMVSTVWLLQVGSTQSKVRDELGLESDKDQKVGRHAELGSPTWARTGGWRTAVLSNSLLIVMGLIFLVSWLAQSIAGWATYNEARLGQLRDPVSWTTYVLGADFWERTLQNWQSEFLAVGSMVVLSVYLRQRGSPESKPVGASHDSTGAEG